MLQRLFPDDCALTDRGGVLENTHRVHAAVTDATGKLLLAVGNPHRMTLARSAAKPVQILAVLETPGLERYGFEDADVALMCASHSSEERHVTRATQMLETIQAKESDLRCGGHPAISPSVNRDWIKRDFTPSPLYSNCSAKHVGMLASALALGGDTSKEYHLPDHPVQTRVKRAFEDLSGLSPNEIRWGIDGCNLPTPSLPLRDISHIYATLAEAGSLQSKGEVVSPRLQHLGRIFHAMSSYPELVGGDGRFCTLLGSAYKGALIGKIGADGCYGVAVRESDQTRKLGASGSLGIAVKIDDGDLEILYACVAEILEQLGINESPPGQSLSSFHRLKRVNTMGVVTGVISMPFRVRRI